MAKKSRRSRAQSSLPARKKTQSQIAPIKTGTDSAPARVKTVRSSEQPVSAALELQRRYVMTELRRIGIIAGSLVIVIILLTFMLG